MINYNESVQSVKCQNSSTESGEIGLVFIFVHALILYRAVDEVTRPATTMAQPNGTPI